MQRQATTNVTMLENRITKLEMNSENGMDALRKKLLDQRMYLASKLDKKLDLDAAMNENEHESFITDIAKTATRAYLRKILDDKVKDITKTATRAYLRKILDEKVKDIVDDLFEDILYGKLAQRDAVLARLIKDRNAAIKSMLDAHTDQLQLELDEQLAATRRALEEQRREIDTMWGWIRTLSDGI